MLTKSKDIWKEYKTTIMYLSKIYKDKKESDILKMIFLIKEIKDKKKRKFELFQIKKLYYTEVLKKEYKVKLGERLHLTNTFIKLNLKKNKGIIYSLYKGKNERQNVISFELVSKQNIKRYKSLFLYSFLENGILRANLKKKFELTNYQKFFIWPFLITIKRKIIILRNIFFKNYFILKYEEYTNILSWIEYKTKFKSSDILLDKINIFNLNMLNNSFIKNKSFLLKKKYDLNYNHITKNENEILKLYFQDLIYKKKEIFFNFLDFLKKKNIDIPGNFFSILFIVLIRILKCKKSNKLNNNDKMNIYFWNKDNNIFTKTFNTKQKLFFKYKKSIKIYAKKSLINYSFFLRLYMLYFFWFLYFFNKIFYYFNKISFNLWFRFFYFLHSSLNFNSKLFFSFKKLYNTVYFYNKNINFFFEFENMFINYIENIKNIFYSNKMYILYNTTNNIFLNKFLIKNLYFIFKNYFFCNTQYFYNNFLKNIINKLFKLENNLFDLLHTSNYSYNNMYNKEYFIINGSICKKFNYFYNTKQKKKNKLDKIELLNLEALEEKRKKTLFLY